jgi:F0F1-type ATP synthase assembly protein I
MYMLIKIISSAAIIGIITELARRFPVYGGMIAALPLVSLLSIIWLTFQGESAQNVTRFTLGVLSGLPATIVMLFVIYIAFKQAIQLPWAIAMGIAGWGLFLLIQNYVTQALIR